MIGENLERYVDLPVVTFEDDDDEAPAGPVAWRVATEYDEEPFGDIWKRFCETVDTTAVTALVIGYWGSDYDEHEDYPVPLLAESAASFPNLRSLFFGDITYMESEISWIVHEDITPLFRAFPALERLDVRGVGDLSLDPIRSESLKVLRFESGGLPATVVQAVMASDLPNLEHLDLWLGTEDYGGDVTAADLAPVLSGERFPALRHLGLEDSVVQDEIAEAVAGAPVVARLESLSLAMGTLTDRGAEALLAGQPLTHLRELDLNHHFISEPIQGRITAALPGVRIKLKEAARDEPYVEVSE
ncbi:STM4015 family protein [Actinomadura sp. WMMB 499]|uniref:STM4015 family protein n=1 Tax=Actinomadura sp. WMMB 499 TaxID=1219491 RepID=UPI001246751E|nr:STM4015 family protein [Actinomadura sp. WMMB 499]QFG20967.1 leucine-rich repeat domain-containing protein [Actinomadura sp. WMMB 499]